MGCCLNVLLAVWSIVGHFRRSTVAYDKLKKIHQQLDIPETRRTDQMELFPLHATICSWTKNGTCACCLWIRWFYPCSFINPVRYSQQIYRHVITSRGNYPNYFRRQACISVIILVVRVLKNNTLTIWRRQRHTFHEVCNVRVITEEVLWHWRKRFSGAIYYVRSSI